MKKLMMACVAACAAVSAWAESALYRVRLDGGEWQMAATIADAKAIVDAAWSTVGKVEFELLADDAATWSSTIQFYQTTQVAKDIVIRSCSDGSACYRLTRTAATARFSLTSANGKADQRIRFENIIIDGGAVWTNPEVPWDATCTGVGAGYVFDIGGSVGNYVILGKGTTVENCTFNANGVINVSGGKLFRIENGATVQSCRGGSNSICVRMSGGAIEIDGGIFCNNYSKWDTLWLCAPTIKDAIVANNYIGTATTRFAVTLNNKDSDKVKVLGSTVIRDNFYRNSSTGALALQNVGCDVELAGDLTENARIGVFTGGGVVDAQFGISDSTEFAGANRLRWDGNAGGVCRVGAITPDGKLVWADGEPDEIVYEANDCEAFADGDSYGISVNVSAPKKHEITYSTTQSGPYVAEQPKFTDEGEHTVWYRITAKGCPEVSGSQKVVLNHIDLTDILYRTRVGNGAWSYWKTLQAAVGEVNKSSGADRDLQLMADDAVSLNALITLAPAGPDAAAAPTVRICSVPWAERPYRVKRLVASSGAKLQIYPQTRAAVTIVFTDIVFDGGAVWTNPDDLLDTGNTGLNPSTSGADSTVIEYTGNTQGPCLVEFGDGFVLENCTYGANGAIRYYTYSSVNGQRLRISGTATFRNNRGGENSQLFRMDNNKVVAEVLGGFYTNNCSQWPLMTVGEGAVVSNVHMAGNYIRDFARPSFQIGGTVLLTGAPYIRDNIYTNSNPGAFAYACGTERNLKVCPESAFYVAMGSGFCREANVGITGFSANGNRIKMRPGDKFGSVGDGANERTAKCFHYDYVKGLDDPIKKPMIGTVDGEGNLVWGFEKKGLMLLVW